MFKSKNPENVLHYKEGTTCIFVVTVLKQERKQGNEKIKMKETQLANIRLCLD
jgi:hypothetical protein